MFLAAPALNPNINLFFFPKKSKRRHRQGSLYSCVRLLGKFQSNHPIFSHALLFFGFCLFCCFDLGFLLFWFGVLCVHVFCFGFPPTPRIYICWYLSLIQFWLNYYALHYFVLFTQINMTKHKVTIFPYGVADLGIFWCYQSIWEKILSLNRNLGSSDNLSSSNYHNDFCVVLLGYRNIFSKSKFP